MPYHPSPDELHRIEIAWAVRTAIFGGSFASLIALVFYDGGRFLKLIIGG